jgi:predicted ArsR family transcriptional regulator
LIYAARLSGPGRRRLASANGDDDELLTALRTRGSATTAELAEALGTPAAELRSALRPLLLEGVVYRTGHAKTTRYHA